MQESLKSNEPQDESLEIRNLSSWQYTTKDQIKKIQQQDLNKNYEPISEIFNIEVFRGHRQQGLNKFMLESKQSKSFLDEHQQKQSFAQEIHFGDKKPLKIDKTKNFEISFNFFFKDLKSNQYFPNIIPLNTIVLAKSYDQLLWPAIIVNVQQFKTSNNYKRYVYKVNFIDSENSYSLTKNYFVKFNSKNIERIKKFFDSKKLNKALKIAQKMFHLQSLKKSKALLTENFEEFIEIEQIPLNVSIKIQNHQKSKPINFVIETQRIKPRQFSFHDESQTDSDQELKDNVQKTFPQKGFCNNEIYQSQQEHLSSQKSFKIVFQDKNELLKKKSAKQGSQLQKCFKQKVIQQKQKQKLFERISKYLLSYRRSLKKIKSSKREKSNDSIENLFNFLSLPLTDFKIEHFSRYSAIIDSLLLICTQNYLNLKDQDVKFIKKSKEVLIKLYHSLEDYGGQTEFTKSLKMLQLFKLKNFKQNILKTKAKIQQ